MDKNINTTTVKGLQAFAHGAYYGNKGEMLEMPTAIANELAAAGLVATVTEKVSKETTPTPPPPVEAPVAPAPEEKPAEDAPAPGIKAAATVHNKMAKPVANKAK